MDDLVGEQFGSLCQGALHGCGEDGANASWFAGGCGMDGCDDGGREDVAHAGGRECVLDKFLGLIGVKGRNLYAHGEASGEGSECRAREHTREAVGSDEEQ